jgi:hypothetical protein
MIKSGSGDTDISQLKVRNSGFDVVEAAKRAVDGHKVGLKSKFLLARVEASLGVLARGGTRRLAALAADVDSTTFYRWLEDYPSFKVEVDAAERCSYGFVMDRLMWNVDKGNIAAIIFWLKNRQPEDWQDKPLVKEGELVPQLSIEFPDGKKVTLDAKKLKEDPIKKAIKGASGPWEDPPKVLNARKVED